MSLAVRVIPCLDVHAGRVVKGVNFVDLRDAGDPVEMARIYDAEGADELCFLDITASSDSRETTYDVVSRTAEQVFIPLTVGGGVRTPADVERLLRAGADKVAMVTAAIEQPPVIAEIAGRFGSQVLVLSIDARRNPEQPSGFEVTTHGGRRSAGLDLAQWAARGCELGAGEILLNSMDADGTSTCDPNRPAISAMTGGCSIAAVTIATLSAPARNNRSTSVGVRTPPPTVSGMKTCSAVRDTTS